MDDKIRQDTVARLKNDGCEGEIFQDRITRGEVRQELATAIAKCDAGDVLVLERLSDAARSMFEIKALFDTLQRKAVALRILYFFGKRGDEPLDTRQESGVQFRDYVKEFHNVVELGMIERRLTGIEAAKSKGVYQGRKPLAQERIESILSQSKSGELPRSIAKSEGVSIATVYRVLKHQRVITESQI
jgi:DNA invertase Pin-like site-specific DNA recombinase